MLTRRLTLRLWHRVVLSRLVVPSRRGRAEVRRQLRGFRYVSQNGASGAACKLTLYSPKASAFQRQSAELHAELLIS
ncbi:hypothetical protein GCM10022247_70660 [Allokutzneria multivorans]|uniref:Secreted protein n=1 Tax=Allokutzneria multivorans TaxID=1142134 RepID=A0ABP7U3B8_9PSEU